MSEQRPIAAGLRFAEAPRWHSGALWFSDVHAYALKRVADGAAVETIASVPGRPAGLGTLPDGRLLMATALDRKLWSVAADGTVSAQADLSAIATGLLNDMVVSGNGDAYVGDTGFNMSAGEKPRPGRLIHWRAGAPASVVAEDLVFPNGCVVAPDGSHLLIAETMAHRITRFEIASDGSLGARSPFASLDSPPDGMCMDADGALWVALPLQGKFVRITQDGRIARSVSSTAPFAVSCALGGPGRQTLLLCSAYTDLDRLARGDTTARIDALEVERPGAGWP